MLKNKTRWLAGLLTGVLCLSMAACGSTAQSTPATAEPAAETSAPATPSPSPVAQNVQSSAIGAATPYKIETKDGLLTIELPNTDWYELQSDEYTEMFSDGDCAILVNLYRSTDTVPAIATVDPNHALVYNATVSSGNYLLHVIGYAANESDFSGICKSINTINVNLDRITDAMLNHSINTDEYSIRECSYTAWVNTATLKVRSTSSESGELLATLSRDDQLTVTGSVLKNGNDIGWSRVRLSNGNEGYVSTQFLTTYDPQNRVATATGKSTTLYAADGSAVVLYQYSDSSWRTSSGVVFWAYTSDTWKDSYGDYLYTYQPAAYRTGVSFPLYYSNGSYVMVYEYSDDTYRDDYGNYYSKYNAGQWQCADGTILDLEYTPAYVAPYRTGICFPLYYSWGDVVYVYEYSDDTYRDDYGTYYSKYNAGQWQRSDGTILDLDPPAQEYSYDDYSQDSGASYTGVSFPLYYSDGDSVTVYEYSDNTYRDDYGYTYSKYNAGQWQRSDGTILGLDPDSAP